jgi:lysozyme family protein
MKVTFDQAIDLVIGIEGGYTNDPRDPGGETRYGISKRSHPNEDIKGLTLARAKEIYRAEYWNPCKCDFLPSPLNLYMFDSAVNEGPKTAALHLQRVLNITQDGEIGPKTIAAANRLPIETSALFMTDRSMAYIRNLKFSVYGKGWLKRLFIVAMGPQ